MLKNSGAGNILTSVLLYFVTSAIFFTLFQSIFNKFIPEPSATIMSALFAMGIFVVLVLLGFLVSRGGNKNDKGKGRGKR